MGGGRDQGWASLSFSYVNFKEKCRHSCVICDCIEKMNSIFLVAPLFSLSLFFMFLCRYFYCKMNVLFLSDTTLFPVELLHSVCFDQYKPLIV